MKCTGLCYQGRSACTTPAACGLTAQKLYTRNSDGSSRTRSEGSATAPMPISMEPSEDDQDNGARLSATEWALVIVALSSGIFSLAMIAGYALVKLS